eukprot:TRINITY_DN6982_c0_g1_i3.p1 TRINITY_DN6982_c0_g1~~TRINITY_DN6982_c0_g1_i3.p1  ORF type:complete len:462 (+),score=80.06 TRINITY_DN6982_c0_g1_i3:77-1462(+)
MGINTSSSIEEDPPETTISKLQNIPYGRKIRVSNVRIQPEFEDWLAHISVHSLVCLLLREEDFQKEQFKLEKAHEIAYAFTGLLLIFEQRGLKRPRNRLHDVSELEPLFISNIVHKLIHKYVRKVAQFTYSEIGPKKLKMKIGQYVIQEGWVYLQDPTKEVLRELVIKKNIQIDFRDYLITTVTDFDPDLYESIREIALNEPNNHHAWIILARYERVEDQQLILDMLKAAKDGQLLIESDAEEIRKISNDCSVALHVVHKCPIPLYFDTLCELWEESMTMQNQIDRGEIKINNIAITHHLNEIVLLLLKAIAIYKNNRSIEIMNTVANMHGKSHEWLRLRVQWINATLMGIEDKDCFYLEQMHFCAIHGKISLKLLKRVMAHDPEVALAWICDVSHPIVQLDPDEDNYTVDDQPVNILRWALSKIVEHNSDNVIDVLCYYIKNETHDTCVLVNTFALNFER